MWRTWGFQCGDICALAWRLHGFTANTILKSIRLARLKKNGVELGTIYLPRLMVSKFRNWVPVSGRHDYSLISPQKSHKRTYPMRCGQRIFKRPLVSNLYYLNI